LVVHDNWQKIQKKRAIEFAGNICSFWNNFKHILLYKKHEKGQLNSSSKTKSGPTN